MRARHPVITLIPLNPPSACTLLYRNKISMIRKQQNDHEHHYGASPVLSGHSPKRPDSSLSLKARSCLESPKGGLLWSTKSLGERGFRIWGGQALGLRE